jgi:hypothetical protein
VLGRLKREFAGTGKAAQDGTLPERSLQDRIAGTCLVPR